MKYIVSWSGGKDSTYMLFELLRRGFPVDEIICVDTTIEFPEMYLHQQEVENRLFSDFSLKVTHLRPEHNFEYYLLEYTKQRGKYAGMQGLGWPNPNFIWCRGYLKLGVMDKYLRSKYGFGNYTSYIGIAFDEISRYDFSDLSGLKSYPLISWRVTELEALKGCYDLGFDFQGLYNRFFRVSCWCCPLQSIKELYMLYSFYPHLWRRLRDLDSRQRNRFRKDYSLEELEVRFSESLCYASSLETKVSEPACDRETKVSELRSGN